MPTTSQPRWSAAMVAARTTAFSPGASPPPVESATRRIAGRAVFLFAIAGVSPAPRLLPRAEPRGSVEAGRGQQRAEEPGPDLHSEEADEDERASVGGGGQQVVREPVEERSRLRAERRPPGEPERERHEAHQPRHLALVEEVADREAAPVAA